MSSRFFYISESDKREMLDAIGIDNVDDIYDIVPRSGLAGSFELDDPMPEHILHNYMRSLARKNLDTTKADFFIGAGCYNHHVPASVDYIVQRSEYMTAYTPYQPEVSQGSLAAMFEFQTIITRLTGMDVANGSMYDGATASAEAALMSCRINGKTGVYLFNKIHPHYEAVINSSCTAMNIANKMSDNVSCVILQQPDFHGSIADVNAARALADAHNAILIVVVNEILALGLLPEPKEADIVIGEARSLGVPMSFGGPHVGFFACKDKFMRQMPGRICGETVDANGVRAFALTICAREQHIKRDRATSNICTNQFLLALAFTIHVALLGEIGFKKLAAINHERCVYMADLLASVDGVRVKNETFFNELTIEVSFNTHEFVAAMVSHQIIAGYPISDSELLIAVTELNTRESIERYVRLIESYNK